MKRFNLKNEKGFVALISTVVISAVLLVAAASVSRAAFWARFGLLARENKKISAARAEGCVQAALLIIVRNENVDVSEKCENLEISIDDPRTITATVNWKNSRTNLRVTAKLENNKITINDWREF